MFAYAAISVGAWCTDLLGGLRTVIQQYVDS
jgi:hypothetical protein